MASEQSTLTRQTRDSFDVAAVRAMLLRGDSPPQGWVSLMDEALHLISRLREATDHGR